MATAQEIVSFLESNPNLSDREIASVMGQYGVTPQQLAQAVNMPVADIQSRYDAATQSGVALPDTIPARPTFSGVAAEWNELHKQRFGTYLNIAGRENDPAIATQVAELQATTTAAQNAWDALYGDTPEGKIIKENPPPDWRDTYEPWLKQHTDVFGGIINRPWSSDADAINQKAELDKAYLKSVEDYNAKHGTNIAPDPDVLGSMVQPNEFYKAADKEKWYKNPVKAGLALAAIAGGAYYLLGPGTAAGAAGGTAGGAGGAGGAGAGGAGAAGAGAAAAPISVATGIPAASAAFPAIEIGAQYSLAPGSFQAALPGLGVSVAGPATAGAGTFAAAVPSLLSATPATFGVMDALRLAGDVGDVVRVADAARGLLGGDEQPQPLQAAGGAALQTLPFPSIYDTAMPGLLPLAQQFQRPSLLG